jgi:hypothetical protein
MQQLVAVLSQVLEVDQQDVSSTSEIETVRFEKRRYDWNTPPTGPEPKLYALRPQTAGIRVNKELCRAARRHIPKAAGPEVSGRWIN